MGITVVVSHPLTEIPEEPIFGHSAANGYNSFFIPEGIMMDIFFTDPTDIPLPPNEVRIRSLRARVWPDGRRVRVDLEITPFLKRPNGEILISDAQGNELANISIIETMDPKMEFTLHLRGSDHQGPYRVDAMSFYNEETEQPADSEAPPEPSKQIVVDRAETAFDISEPEKGE